MAPEIYKDGILYAITPDKTGTYPTLNGGIISINVDGIDADNKQQPVIIEDTGLGGVRMVGLTLQGVGTSLDWKRSDMKLPVVGIKLIDRPIRISYTDRVWVERTATLADPRPGGYVKEVKRTYKNPTWLKKNGR